MGMAESAAVPKIAFVAPPRESIALDGTRYGASEQDVLARAISLGNCHRAFPLTAAMCLAVAARLDGTLVHEAMNGSGGRLEQPTHGTSRASGTRSNIRLGHPSGVLPLDAAVSQRDGEPWAERVTVYRTARRLMEGWIRVP